MKICFCGGSGHSGTVLAALPRLKDVQATAFCRTYPGERSAAASNLPLKEYSDLAQMLDTEHPDILVSDGMFSRHSTDAAEALSRGIAVFCEKPVALNMDQLEILRSYIRPDGPLFWAMQTSRYMDCFYTAKQLTDQGVIGKIRMMNSQKSYKLGTRPAFFQDRSSYGGTIPWVSIHAIDWMLWIAGRRCQKISSFQSRLDNRNNGTMEMTALSIMELEDGILAHVNTDYYRPDSAPTHGDDRLRIVGTEGILEVRDSQVYLTDASHDGQTPLPLQSSPRLLFEDFVHTMRGGEGSLITPEDSLYSTFVALKAQEAADLGQILII